MGRVLHVLPHPARVPAGVDRSKGRARRTDIALLPAGEGHKHQQHGLDGDARLPGLRPPEVPERVRLVSRVCGGSHRHRRPAEPGGQLRPRYPSRGPRAPVPDAE
eukprot:16442688-Heterocapsa_arctica.AAC.1